MSKFRDDISEYNQQWQSYLVYLIATGQYVFALMAKQFIDSQMSELNTVPDKIDQFCSKTSPEIDSIRSSGDSGALALLMSEVKDFCNTMMSRIASVKSNMDSIRGQFSGGVADIQSAITNLQSQYDELESEYQQAVAQSTGPYDLQPRIIAAKMAPIALEIANLRFTAGTIDGLEATLLAMESKLKSEYDALSNMGQDIDDGIAILDDVAAFVEELENS